MPRPSNLLVQNNRELLAAALEGLQLQRQRIDEQIRQVRDLLGKRGRGRPSAAELLPNGALAPVSAGMAAAPKKRVLSEAARKRIAAAQKKRWAEARKNKGEQHKG